MTLADRRLVIPCFSVGSFGTVAALNHQVFVLLLHCMVLLLHFSDGTW